MNDDDNDGQMIFGDLGGPKLPGIYLTGEENPHPGNLSCCVTVAHATAWPTAVDLVYETPVDTQLDLVARMLESSVICRDSFREFGMT